MSSMTDWISDAAAAVVGGFAAGVEAGGFASAAGVAAALGVAGFSGDCSINTKTKSQSQNQSEICLEPENRLRL